MIIRFVAAVVLLFSPCVSAIDAIDVNGHEAGTKWTGQSEILHDPQDSYSIDEVARRYRQGEFRPLLSAGSTGLQPGAFWSHFALHNSSDRAIAIDVEYVDHQLIELAAFQRPAGSAQGYRQFADMSLLDAFDSRPVPHNRFVFQVRLPPGQTRELMVRFSSHQSGFVFPSMRIWSPQNLRSSNNAETAIVMFLFGGIFLMAVVSLVGGLATRDRNFFNYSVYALSKIVSWCTILGYTHQFFLTEHFHWRYMSIGGALGIIFGVHFARGFLQTRIYTRKLDYVLVLMIGNAVFMLVCAALGFNALAVGSITLALLLYPVVCVAGVVRWRQGSTDAGIFAFAWSLLVLGLAGQALRDLGMLEHGFVSYYLPAFASFFEMVGILMAMGIRLRRMRLQNDEAEDRYLLQLELSKVELEDLVRQRTRELESAKEAAELEARTDPLTAIYNRRSFFDEAQRCLRLARRKGQPLSLLMFDIDHFKSINDNYGHSTGDEALRRFSDSIARDLRDTDIWGRIGGEEFALMLYEDRPGAMSTARRLHGKISAISIPTPSGDVHLTASIGIAHLESEQDIEALLHKADRALYRAKEEGRNRIVESGVAEPAA